MDTKEKTSEIRRLNDDLRNFGRGGRMLMTCGIQALGNEVIAKIMRAVAEFKDFTNDNDPHHEHDCAALSVDGVSIIWKIDYYDTQLSYHSPDPANPTVTVRVLTVMRANEY